MTYAYLYKNVVGKPVTKHSHSGGQDFSCPRKYKYKRVDGYQARDERAALQFGHCVEDAIMYFHNKNFEPGSGVDEFKQLWFRLKNDTSILYTEKTGNWGDHYRMGVELLKLYESICPELPITNATFQVEKTVDLFDPEDMYGGLQYTAKADMICLAPDNHPLLPNPGADPGAIRALIVDIKTSSNPYYTDARLSALDDQLRDYSWVFGIPTVAFLVLVKNFTEPETGDWVTVLEGPKAGKKYQVFDNNGTRVVVLNKSDYDEYSSRKKALKLTSKAGKEALVALQAEYLTKAQVYSRESVTKQRIQFLPAVISPEDGEEARRVAQTEAMEISDCGERDFFPKKPGVRFPHNPCTMCECLGLCIGDESMVREKLIKIDGVF